ncbi:MAG: transposase [Bacteroidales bacterium]|nr:transposase [Bacteroidales bacterium]
MTEHPHLHVIMPAGGLSFDKTHWVHTKKSNDFFIHYKVLSRKFRGKKNFSSLLNSLYKKAWVVNIQKSFARPQKVLEYLSPYVFRIAISDRRIKKVKNGVVHFMVKDYRRNGIFRKQKLEINEFIRRFLLHVLPQGFFKVRYYGIFANTCRKKNIAKAKELLSIEKAAQRQEDIEDGRQTWEKQDTIWVKIMEGIKQHLKLNCPVCKKGRMQFVGVVPGYGHGFVALE